MLVFLLIPNIKIVPQAHEYVIECLGKYKATWGAGMHFKVPFIERVAKIIEIEGISVNSMENLIGASKGVLGKAIAKPIPSLKI